MSVEELTYHLSAVGWPWHRGDAPALPLDTSGSQESCPSPAAALWRVSPIRHLDGTAELTLGVEGQSKRASPEGENSGELTLSLICYEVAWEWG